MTRFPENKRFAFTVFDDTDNSTVENVGAVYRLLCELGIRTTKSVWALPNVAGAKFHGSNLYDPDYLDWVLKLQAEGFEIAMHNVRNSDSPRDVVERGLIGFEQLIGKRPRIHANHSSNRENIYWGSARLSSNACRTLYNVATGFRYSNAFLGHIRGSEYFWGDICKKFITYVRNFAVNEINLDRVNPTMPYHNPAQPFVNYWFTSCDGHDVNSFCNRLSEENQDDLEAEGGVCIMYTHFAAGFSNGTLDHRFEALMRRIANKKGWFVPVSTLLDFLRSQRMDSSTISAAELGMLERRWLLYKLHTGRT
jgi:hypothetical protein